MHPSAHNIIAWLVRALAAAFIFSGSHKLSDLPGTIKMVGGLGLPGWFAYLIGGAELLGGIDLLVPPTMRPAALGLIIIVPGALFTHATRIPGGRAKGVLALLVRHRAAPGWPGTRIAGAANRLFYCNLPGSKAPALGRATPAAEPSPRPRVANCY